jgi:hypothetical protein
VQCSFGGGSCGQQSFSTGAQSASMTLAFPAGFSGGFTLTDCNGSSQSDAFAGNACNGGTSSSVAANGPPNPPVGGVCAGDDGNTATFDWAKPADVGARTVTSYRYTGAATGSTASTRVSIPASNNGATMTIHVYSVDSAGEQSAAYESISCTNPSPPPPPSISAYNSGVAGTSTTGSCMSAGCHWIYFNLSNNFPSGTYQWHCVFDDGSDYIIGTHSFVAGGSYGNGYCLVGPGETGHIKINGITSNGVPG